MALYKSYFKDTASYIEKYGEKTVMLIQVGAFYEIYGKQDKSTGEITGSSLSAISKLCNLKVATKQEINKSENLVMIGFRDYSLDKYVPLLTNDGWTVPVINQDAATSNTTRSLYKIFSPGTTFLVDDKSITNNIMSVWMEKKFANSISPQDSLICGISTIDIYTGRSYIHEYRLSSFKHIPSSYDELERFYSTYKPKEILFIYKNLQEGDIEDIIKFLNIYAPVRKISYLCDLVKRCEQQIYQHEQLNKFYKITDYSDFCERTLLNEYEVAKQSFCYLLDTIFVQNKDLIKNITEPLIYDYSNNIILANHSLKQLNMISVDNNYIGKLSSVVDFLTHHCATAMGKRQLKQQVLNPTSNVKSLNEKYSIVNYVKERTEFFSPIAKQLRSLFDIEKFYRKIILKNVKPVDMISLYENIQIIIDVYKNLSDDPLFSTYSNKFNIKESCDIVSSFIYDTLDFDKCANDIDCNIFRKGVHPSIDVLVDKLDLETEKLNSVREYLESLIIQEKRGKNNAVEINKTDKNGYSILVTKRRSTLIRSVLSKQSWNNKNIILKLKSGDSFSLAVDKLQFIQSTSSKVRIENNIIKDITRNIEVYSRKIIDEVLLNFNIFVEKFLNYREQMMNMIHYSIDIDIFLTQGIISHKYNYCCPTILDKKQESSFVDAKNMRHLLIEQLHQQELYVPNDISLGKGENGILLFGTNAVGKSSLIKGLGICVILAQSGMFVPCSEFTYKPYQSIFTRILGNDNIFKGLSSFAVEMIELNTILRLSNKNSLILGDELCSGTETTSAICIFSSGIIKLQERMSSFIFATHFHEICKIKAITSLQNVVMKHMKVIYNEAKDRLEYSRVLSDGPGLSEYGLEVCKSLSMPDDFIGLAYELRMEIKKENQTVLSKKRSKYNSKKIKGLCEICRENEGVDTHHLQYQNDADKSNGIINGTFHKDHVANLINICKDCHTDIHRKELKFKKVKTTDGYELELL